VRLDRTSYTETSIPGGKSLPICRELHRSKIDRRMRVEKGFEPLSPAGIRGNVGEQRLDDQRDHIKAVVPYAVSFPRHGQLRLDGKFSIPQSAVVRTDVADRRQGVEPAYKDRLRLIEFAGDFLPEARPQVFIHLRQRAETYKLGRHPHWQIRLGGILRPVVPDEDLGRSTFLTPENLHEVGMIECRGEIGRVSIAEHAQVFSDLVRNEGPDADLNRVQGFENKPPQIHIEFVEINDLLEGRPRTKIAGGRIFEGNEIRAQTVIANSSQPIQRTGPVGTSKAATDQ